MNATTPYKFINVRIRKKAGSSLITFLGLGWVLSGGGLFSQPASVALESAHLKPLQEQQQSRDQQQKYFLKKGSDFSRVPAACSKSQQQVSAKNYADHSFLGLKNSWVRKKGESDDVKSVWWGSQKQLKKKVFQRTACYHPSEILMGRSFEAFAYPTKTFFPQPESQGKLNDIVAKAIQQKKSPAEVRAMLEKEF